MRDHAPLAGVERGRGVCPRGLLVIAACRLLVISVNAEAPPNPNWPQQRNVSGLGQILSAATGAQISAYNLETVIAVEHTAENVVDKLRRMRCRQGYMIMGYPCDDVAGTLLRVNLADYDEPETRTRLLAVRTGLTLRRDQVDELVSVGATMIRRNAGTIARFLERAPQASVLACARCAPRAHLSEG